MTSLNHRPKLFTTDFKLDLETIAVCDRNVPDATETAEFARFKVQLKRAVDSVDAPQYLIDAIKNAIRS